MFAKLDSQSLCIYLELLSMKGIRKSIILHGIRAQVINKSQPTGRNWVVAPPTQGPMCEGEIVGLSHIGCGRGW